jgi:superoxide dismutase, Cu-Zn family
MIRVSDCKLRDERWIAWLTVSGLTIATLLSAGAIAQNAQGTQNQLSVVMRAVSLEGIGASRGRIVVTEQKNGLVFRPSVTGLQTGLHGFHVHEKPDCNPGPMEGGGRGPAKAAGGHWDPGNTNRHAAPWEDGHFGDLPVLYVDEKRVTEHPVFKPGMRLRDLRGHALIIHHGGDNYKSEPDPTGGGGPAALCGVIPVAAEN